MPPDKPGAHDCPQHGKDGQRVGLPPEVAVPLRLSSTGILEAGQK